MLSFFIKSRRGSITVMLSFLLVAALSLNATFLETSRYRSLERLYKEIEENAAFSVLSQYDRELLENFGLLAVSKDVGEEQFMNYLQSNLNYLLADGNGVDHFLEVSADQVTFEKLYDLAQSDVLKMQINEFCTYRAPLEALNGIFNIEEAVEEKVEELVQKLNETFPLLQKFDELADKAGTVLDTLSVMVDFAESFKSLKEQYDEFQNTIDTFNASVRERKDYKDHLDEGDEGYDQAGYLSVCSNVASNAAEIKNSVVSLKSSLEEFYESYETFKDSVKTMKDAGISEKMKEPVAASDGNVQEMTEAMDDTYQQTEDSCDDITNKMAGYQQEDVEQSKADLESLTSQLNGEWESLEEVDAVELVKWDNIESAAESAKMTIQEAEEKTEENASDSGGGFASLKKVLTAVKKMADIQIFNDEYSNTISEGWDELPSRSGLTAANNPHESDLSMVSAQIAKTAEVAGYTGFDINTLHPDDSADEYMELQNAMQAVKEKGEDFRQACEDMSLAGILAIINSLKAVLTTLTAFLESLAALVATFVKVVTGGLLQTVLYQKLNPAIYATAMFSNRTTDLSSDTRMNGSSFTNYAGQESVFAMADAEYVLIGNKSEIMNQTLTFTFMLMFRLLCNIPALLMDSNLRSLVQGLCGIPVVGWIAAIVVVIALILCEAWLDMTFLVQGSAVDIIKLTGYLNLSGDGIDDLQAQIEDLMENGSGGEGGYADSLTKWDYKEHMLFMLLVFTSGNTMYTRCADLIQMQMRQSEEGFKLSEMATYIRVESEASYTPLLPIPAVPGLNSGKLKIKSVHYSGY